MDWREAFARRLLRRRFTYLMVFALVTLAFSLGLPRVQLETVFSDLLPSDDPFVQVYRDHPNFGNPLTMVVMVKRREGDLFNQQSLRKVWKLTQAIDLAPGVDHASIVSITTEKARYSEATSEGVDMRPLMDDQPPANEREIEAFRSRVDKTPNVRVFMLSPDDSATLISATFIEHRVDYGEAFDYVQDLVEQARDDEHDVYLVGQPVLFGWIYRHESELLGIFACTAALLLLVLGLYMRSASRSIIPILTSGTAAIWAFGFVGWLDISIEPLLMVVPLLLVARSFSHSVQFIERFDEMLLLYGSRDEAAVHTFRFMFTPSVLSIITDALGIAVVMAAPIPAMVRHAIFCGMWAIWIIPTGVILISLLLASMPMPPSRKNAGWSSRGLDKLLAGITQLSAPKHFRKTTVAVLVMTVTAIVISQQIQIGNPVQGSNLLSPESEFNQAVTVINAHFPGTNTLEIVLEARDPEAKRWTVQQVDTVQTMQALQLSMESSALPPRASLSFADYLSEVTRLFNGGHSKWLPLDPRERALNAATVGAMMGASSTSYSHVISENVQDATVSFWYADNRQATVDAALLAATQAVAAVGVEHDLFRVRLGTGIIALQEAVNRVIERYHLVIVLIMDGLILLLFSVAYRSLVAGVLLLVPVNVAHGCMLAMMHLLGVGLDVNSMIVAAIGLGVGIDYGIYLLSRVCEEASESSDDALHDATARALASTGKAIAFTALMVTLSITPLIALSDIKFMVDMGVLIMAVMLINMLTALVLLPLLINGIKPKFIRLYL